MVKLILAASVAAASTNCQFQIAQFGNCFVGVSDANPPCNTNVDVTVISDKEFSVYYIEANGATLYKHTHICNANVTVSVNITDQTIVDFKCYNVECDTQCSI